MRRSLCGGVIAILWLQRLLRGDPPGRDEDYGGSSNGTNSFPDLKGSVEGNVRNNRPIISSYVNHGPANVDNLEEGVNKGKVPKCKEAKIGTPKCRTLGNLGLALFVIFFIFFLLKAK